MADDTSGPEGGESLDVHLDLSATVNDILGRSLIVSAHATHVQWGCAPCRNFGKQRQDKNKIKKECE